MTVQMKGKKQVLFYATLCDLYLLLTHVHVQET